MKAIFCLLVIVLLITQRTCNGDCQPCEDKCRTWYQQCDAKYFPDCINTENTCKAACGSDSCISGCTTAKNSCTRASPNFSDFKACIDISNWALSDCIAKTCP